MFEIEPHEKAAASQMKEAAHLLPSTSKYSIKIDITMKYGTKKKTAIAAAVAQTNFNNLNVVLYQGCLNRLNLYLRGYTRNQPLPRT
jgi:hypothetical protein